MPIGFVAGGRDPQFLITELNLMLNTDAESADTVYDKISLVDTTSTGAIEKYPMQISPMAEVELGPQEEMKFGSAEVVQFECGVKRYTPTFATMIPVDKYNDPYEIVQRHATDVVRQVRKIWDREEAKLINSNGLCYDKSPFFGTHEINPNVPGSGVYSNDLLATPPTETGLKDALDAMMLIRNFDTTRINVDLYNPIILCPNIQIKIAIDKLINSGLIAEQVAGAGASSNTRLVGWGRTILMPELVNDDPQSTRRFYIINDKYANRRAFITRIMEPPTLILTPGGPGDFIYVRNNSRAFYYNAVGGVNYGMPQLAVRCSF